MGAPTAIEWLARFAEFVLDRGIGSIAELLSEFIDDNPELTEPPPEPAQAKIDAEIDNAIEEKFG